jgi:tetratricopeptide (TPR) repeat protein
MDRERIDSLHEAASSHYLRGEFREAAEAWKAVLSIDPSHEQALEGVRMAGMLCEGTGAAGSDVQSAAGSAGLEERRRRIDAIDAHLEAGDAVGAVALAERLALDYDGDEEAALAVERARKEQADAALDRGLSVLDSLSVGIDGLRADAQPRGAAPAPEPAEAEAAEPGASDENPEDPGPEAGLAIVPGSEGPAAIELKRRIEDLLEEAKRSASADRADEAIEILSRVFILDEDNAQAKALEEQLRSAQGETTHDVEMWIAEGVQDFEAGRHDESRDAFRRVLGRYPGHAEALDYLEKIDAALEAREPEAGHQDAASPPEPLRFDEDLLTGGAGAPRVEPEPLRGPGVALASEDPPAAAESIPLAPRREVPAAARV